MKKMRLKILLCSLVGVLFLLSLMPLLYIAKYDLPMGDDLLYGEMTSAAWNESHSFKRVLQAAIEKTTIIFNYWQGTFFSVFLMSLQPAVFSLALYKLTPYIMLGFFIGSTLMLSYVIIVRYLKCKIVDWLLLSFTAMIFQIQFCPSIMEGFFWFNSACLYTLSYCFTLLMFSFLLLSRSAKRLLSKILFLVLALIPTIAVAAGAFSLIIPVAMILVMILCNDILHFNKSKMVLTLVLLALFAAVAVFTITAPGNQARTVFEHEYYQSHGLDTFDAIFKSIVTGVAFVAKYSGLAMTVFAIICCLTLHSAIEKTELKFLNPIILFVVTSGLICMQFTPTLYTLASAGPPRLQNVIYFSLYWYWAINICNLYGWLNREKNFQINLLNAMEYLGTAKMECLHRRVIVIAVVCLTFFSFFQREGDFYANPSVQVITEIRSGLAKDYYSQRLAELQNEEYSGDYAESAILP